MILKDKFWTHLISFLLLLKLTFNFFRNVNDVFIIASDIEIRVCDDEKSIIRRNIIVNNYIVWRDSLWHIWRQNNWKMNVCVWFSSIVHRIRYLEYKWNIDIDWKRNNNNEKKISQFRYVDNDNFFHIDENNKFEYC